MKKVTIIFAVILLISSYMIVKSAGQFRCNKDEDCDPRGCREYSHVICKNHKCTCGSGAPIGAPCYKVTDCNPFGCSPECRVICDFHVCACFSGQSISIGNPTPY
ncbi:defensin-like protein 301 [Eutrema salsugineum]|uniref:defensin-like protein 301 n=1 Tax=Eutrema salsugineum TaxID=72664 RepID=UPI000CED64EB|nr:defensin-like protein 301 [Eutrema salsugineum]